MPYHFQGLALPESQEREALYAALSSLQIDEGASGELADYLNADFLRFLYTLALVPDGEGRGLEIGANPYFMTALLRMRRPGYSFDLVNYFEGWSDQISQRVRWITGDRSYDEPLTSANVNLEAGATPFEDQRFSVILFCEVLEHFTADPVRALRELRRLLKPDGVLVLTTPNVARYENVAALLDGRNLYDPYSGYGPHGRHNREYNRHELHQLMRHCGFEPDFDFTSDVHAIGGGYLPASDVEALLAHIPHRENDLGQYLFSRWRKGDAPKPGLPAWLYRSYPTDQLVGQDAS
ncbi:MAG: methyltransferase domain-containing protein [Pseudoxanthomonas sp.]